MNTTNSEQLVPEIGLQQMTVDEFAACRIALGDRVRRIGSVYWTVGRRRFFRPLLRFKPFAQQELILPKVGLGGFQHAVKDTSEGNSLISFVGLDAPQGYSLQTVDHKRRYSIKTAAKSFRILPIRDLEEFVDKGYVAYLSFYERTGYEYKTERTRREEFKKWAETLLGCPKAVLLGGFGADGLVAVSVSFWVEDSFLYATFFSQTGALQKRLGDLMLHTLRQLAGQANGVHRVVLRPYQGGNGMDHYYLERGASLIHQPAKLYIHPLTSCLLRLVSPARYRMLKGVSAAPLSSGPGAAGPRLASPGSADRPPAEQE